MGTHAVPRAGLVACVLLLAACGSPASPPAFDAHAFEQQVLAARGGEALRRLSDQVVAAGPAVVPQLVRWLEHPARGVREVAAHALGDLAPADPAVAPALAARLEDPDDYVRWKVVRALGRQGARALAWRDALTAIAQADREVEVVRAAAERALLEIDGGRPPP